jgi:ABC-2 type transport system ATP-binding protein
MEILIRVRDLWRDYRGLAAVRGISFELRAGEILGFLGPNGAGKSTSMQVISGNLAPSRGRVQIQGIDILEAPRAAKAQLGYLPERPPLYRELTVDEHLSYCARLHRVPRASLRRNLDTAKERCGLTEVGRRLIGNLSKGYQQRVGIAQAILHRPAVIILDEPTIGLDPLQIRDIRALIRELGGEHGVILSTHVLSEVQAICNRVQILHRGALVLSDSIAGLEQRMHRDSLRVAFRRGPSAEELAQIGGIEGVESFEGGQFRLIYSSGRDPVDELVKRAIEAGWGLRQLTPEQRSLEQIFLECTREEGQPA